MNLIMDMKGVLSLLLFSFILSSCDKEKSVTAIYLEPNEVTVNAGAEFQFVVITEPSDAPIPNCQWSLSPQDKGAEISNTGLFKSTNPGSFTVSVTAKENFFSASSNVIVEALPISSIRFSNDTIAIEAGNDTLLSCAIEPEYASISDVKWESSDESIAIVNDGRIEAKRAGECIITAYYEEHVTNIFVHRIEAKCICTVTPPTLERISLEENDFYFSGLGEGRIMLNVYCYPEGAICPKIQWSTSNANIVKVDEEGWLTAVSAGTCIITATSVDGKFTASYEIKVQEVKVDGIFFADDKEFEIGEGESFLLDDEYISVSPYNASNKNFKLEQISGHDVAQISSDGKSIIGLQEGVAYFKAISEEGGYTDVCKVVVLNKVVANIEVKISLSGWAVIAGCTSANLKCQVWNYNNDPIRVTGLEVLPSPGSGNSNSAYFKYNGEIEYLRSKYWLNSFQNIYQPYYILHFQYGNKVYTKKIR